MHAFLPGTYIDHTHADAILALTNRDDGAAVVTEALGDDVIVLPYVTPGFKLALAAAAALEGPAQAPGAWCGRITASSPGARPPGSRTR